MSTYAVSSVLEKWLESANLLRCESNGTLSRFQTGFREGRSVNEQLGHLLQSEMDGYHE